MVGGIELFTLVHVVLSVVGLFAGFVLVGGLLAGRRLDGWAAAFLVTTILTNVTGFGFPATAVLPSHVVGGLSLLVLPVTAYALYARAGQGSWRFVFVIGAVVSLYLNAFVLVAQLFLKVPAMQALAPTGSEPAFTITQAGLLALFVWIGRSAAGAPPQTSR